jgi:hypothetical protein
MKILQSSIALACLLGADAFGVMPGSQSSECHGHTGNLALPMLFGHPGCTAVTPGYDPANNNPDGSISITQCMRPKEDGAPGELANNYLKLTAHGVQHHSVAYAGCGGEPGYYGTNYSIAIADLCPEACHVPCGKMPTEDAHDAFMLGQFQGTCAQYKGAGFCPGSEMIAVMCPESCGKLYDECDFASTSDGTPGGDNFTATQAQDAVSPAEAMIADCGNEGWAYAWDHQIPGGNEGWGSRAGCSDAPVTASGRTTVGSCCTTAWTDQAQCEAEASTPGIPQYWGYFGTPAQDFVDATCCTPPQPSSFDKKAAMGSTEIHSCPPGRRARKLTSSTGKLTSKIFSSGGKSGSFNLKPEFKLSSASA